MTDSLNQMLEGKLFRADGSAFVVRDAFPGQGRYSVQQHVSGQHTALFDSYGNEVGMVCGVFTYDNELIGVRITTREQFEAEWGHKYTIEDAAEFLGRDMDFLLLDGFMGPTISLVRTTPTWQSGEGWVDIDVEAVSLWYAISNKPSSHSPFTWINIHVENARSEDEEPIIVRDYSIGFADGITELEINGVAVTKIAAYNIRYPRYSFVWTHDSFVITMNQPYGSTLDEAIEIANKFLQ